MGSESERTPPTVVGGRTRDRAVVSHTRPNGLTGLPKTGSALRTGTRSRDRSSPTCNPADSATLRLRKTGTRNEVTPAPLSVRSITEQAAKPQDLGRPRRGDGQDGPRSECLG